ncbi:hypothetical protein SBOR_2535 [Sclerotinia borealis F-4128]|uniref:Uncharacterized protein n=1 Tax=Sclerotinia borealis (strain F-4128) TaxID=1432307 RepID=W9CRI6_SCLBF|nr:hypothetical protein SBOR_2535 [Sclerotinia borealis F-4128]
MSTTEQLVKDERKISKLLWKAVHSQLELEKATENLMKDIYDELKRIQASGGSREDWKTMSDMAQQLINTLKMLKDDGTSNSMIKEEKEEANEDIEEHIEGLMKETDLYLDLGLDQSKFNAALEEKDQHVSSGLTK